MICYLVDTNVAISLKRNCGSFEMDSYIGCRVVRGPDWERNNEDGGEGHLGTVELTMIAPGTTGMTAVVRWDNGFRSNYRAGYDGCFDLRIFDNLYTGKKHNMVKCDSCVKENFYGFRWKCTVCNDYDLCTNCYMNEKHDLNHPFLRIDEPIPFGVRETEKYEKVPSRAEKKKSTAYGIHIGGEVHRISENNHFTEVGKVIVIHTPCIDATNPLQDPSNKGKQNLALVRWSLGHSTLCRIGYDGEVDIECVTSGYIQHYYTDHLPVLGKICHSYSPKCDKPIETNNGSTECIDGMASLKVLVYSRHVKNICPDFDNSFQSVDESLIVLDFLQHAPEHEFVKWIENTDDIDIELPDSKRYHPPLQTACKNGFLKACKHLLDRGANINDRTPDYGVPLHYACLFPLQNRLQIIQLLLERGADPNLDGVEALPPLTSCIFHRSGKSDAINLMVKGGANINARSRDWATPLHYAAQYGSSEILKSIIGYGPIINAINMDHITPLAKVFYAKGNAKTVEKAQLLLQYGADPNISDTFGKTCLHLVSQYNFDDVIYLVKFLFRNGANILVSDNMGNTILHDESIFRGDTVPIVQLLMQNGLNLNASNSFGMTPLHYCLSRGGTHFLKNVKFLIENGASVNSKSNLGRTPFFSLVYCNINQNIDEFNDVLKTLLANGASFNAKDNMGATFLHVACYNNLMMENEHIIPNVLKNGADVIIVDKFRVSPLHMSCHSEVDGFIDVLLKCKNIEINVQDQYGATPLHWAAWHGNNKAIERVIASGGDMKIKDNDGYTPIDVIAMRNHLHLAGYIPKTYNHQFGPHIKIDKNGNIYPYIGANRVNYGDEFLRAILEFPGLGKIPNDNRKVVVETEISEFMQRLANGIANMDSRFTMSIIPSGSVRDGSKCGLLDEFDFMLNLKHFSSITKPILKKEQLTVPPGFVLIQKENEIPNTYEEFFFANQILSRLKLLKYLTHLVYAVCKEKSLLPSSHLMMCLKEDELYLTGASININLRWRCSYFKDMAINIDLVPVLYYENFWPENTRTVNYICDNGTLVTTGCHVALLKYKDPDMLGGKISHTNCEEHILMNLTDSQRNGYILAKAIRGLRFFNVSDLEEEHVCSFFNPANIKEDIDIHTFSAEVTSYALKMALLYLLENDHEDMNAADAITVCRKIYKFLEEKCGNCEEEIYLPVFFIPEISYWGEIKEVLQ